VEGVHGTNNVRLQGQVVVGGEGHTTPTGEFHASSWEKDHTSKRYGWMADTPWSKSFLGVNAFGPFQLHIQELEERGIYIHGTMGPAWSSTTAISGVTVSETSHGCIRMSNSDIIKLHDLLPRPKGVPIRITTDPEEEPKPQ
jgi:lipoprotein-anchoring transpeptidase ErfK/SrfK